MSVPKAQFDSSSSTRQHSRRCISRRLKSRAIKSKNERKRRLDGVVQIAGYRHD